MYKATDAFDLILILKKVLTFVPLYPDLSFFDITVDPDQLASDEATRSGSTMFPLCLKTQAYNLNAED